MVAVLVLVVLLVLDEEDLLLDTLVDELKDVDVGDELDVVTVDDDVRDVVVVVDDNDVLVDDVKVAKASTCNLYKLTFLIQYLPCKPVILHSYFQELTSASVIFPS